MPNRTHISGGESSWLRRKHRVVFLVRVSTSVEVVDDLRVPHLSCALFRQVACPSPSVCTTSLTPEVLPRRQPSNLHSVPQRAAGQQLIKVFMAEIIGQQAFTSGSISTMAPEDRHVSSNAGFGRVISYKC